jgi:hypothetical protein
MECLLKLEPEYSKTHSARPITRQIQLSWDAYSTNMRLVAVDYAGWVHLWELCPTRGVSKCEQRNSFPLLPAAAAVGELTAFHVNRYHLIIGDRNGHCWLLDFRDQSFGTAGFVTRFRPG